MGIAKIITANDRKNVAMYKGYRRWVEMLVNARYPGTRVNWRTQGEAVAAEIHRAGWVVVCPDCPEAIVYEPGEPLFCPNCLNGMNAGFAREVIVPEERRQIEAVLLCRKMPEQMNWLPTEGEDLAVLIAENIAHGDSVPGGVGIDGL